MATKKKHGKKRPRSQTSLKTAQHYDPFWIFEALAGACLIVGYMLTLSPFHKKLALIVFFAAYVLAGLGVVVKLYREFSQPPPNRLDNEHRLPLNPRRPAFSENIDEVKVLVASSVFAFDNMANGHSVVILEVGKSTVVTGKLVNNQLLVDAKLGTEGTELKDNRLTNKPNGWDWQADESNFEIVNKQGIPVFQLTYLTDDTAMIRGVFFDEAEQVCTVVGENDIQSAPATAADVARIKIKPIFKYPSWKYPKERQ